MKSVPYRKRAPNRESSGICRGKMSDDTYNRWSYFKEDEMGYTVPAGISNKHVHLSEADFKTLFGEDAEMSFFKKLSQPGQFRD